MRAVADMFADRAENRSWGAFDVPHAFVHGMVMLPPVVLRKACRAGGGIGKGRHVAILPAVQQVDAEAAGTHHRRVCAAGTVDADGHGWRVKTDGHERGHGEADRLTAVRIEAGDDADGRGHDPQDALQSCIER